MWSLAFLKSMFRGQILFKLINATVTWPSRDVIASWTSPQGCMLLPRYVNRPTTCIPLPLIAGLELEQAGVLIRLDFYLPLYFPDAGLVFRSGGLNCNVEAPFHQQTVKIWWHAVLKP